MMNVPVLKQFAKHIVATAAPFVDPLLDAGQLMSLRVGNPRPHTKHLQLRRVARRVGANVFIETGTFQGLTAMRLASYFDSIYTVELEPNLAAAAKHRLRELTNVECVEGDAMIWLPKILERCSSQNVLVYCDAHFSAGDTTFSDAEDPVIEELEILQCYNHCIGGIVIDDFRCYGEEANFPSKAQVIGAAEKFCSHGYSVRVHLDQILIERAVVG